MINKILLLLLFSVNVWSANLPEQLAVPGGIILIPISEENKPLPEVFFQNKRVMVIPGKGQWLAIVGIPLESNPGKHYITIKYPNEISQQNFIVTNKKYPAQYITIKNKRMVNPNPEDLERIKADRIPINKALNTWSEKTEIDTDFIPPVDGRLSSLFGLKRFFNDQPKNPHSGLDIAAPEGTPIVAPAPAQVINTGNYYYNGNTVFLDHGQGLITGYFHMSEIKVQPGQEVSQGDMLGTVGETGRVTGPHLHWNVYLNKARVDPALFIAKFMPLLKSRNKPKN